MCLLVEHQFGPALLIVAAAKPSGIGTDGRSPERPTPILSARHGRLEAGYNEARFVAGKFTESDQHGLRARAQSLALGVGILDAAQPTEGFTADKRRSLLIMAALAEGERVHMGARIELVQLIRTRMTMRGGGGM